MTTPYPDLGPARQQVLRLMADVCTIERDLDPSDQPLNEQTGQITPDSTTLWTGPCLLTPRPRSDAEQYVGPVDQIAPLRGGYRALIPLDAPLLAAGDLLTVNSSPRDPQLAGTVFRVVEIGEVSTFAVARIFYLDRL